MVLGLGALEPAARRNRADRICRHAHGCAGSPHLRGAGQSQSDASRAGSVHGAPPSGILPRVPDIVFAMIFVAAFGLGALPGILAMAIHTSGALGKLFTEVAENIDMRPVEGIAATGGSW